MSTTRFRTGSFLIVALICAVLAALARLWPDSVPQTAATGVGGGFADVGMPRAPGFDVRVLKNSGFTVGYAPIRRGPAWVAYEARAVGGHRYLDRPRFERDDRVADPVAWAAYADSGFDRGHLAPNFLISNLYGKAAQRDTFLMSNIAPQRPRLNQLVWQRLEEIEADHLAPRWQRLGVTVGPVYGQGDAQLDGGPAIPTAYYRLWLNRTSAGELRALALLVPQSVRGDERLDRFVVSVDAVESETGLDFYPDLPDAVEKRLEADPADPGVWGLTNLACMPARYADDWQGRDGIELRFGRCGE